MNVVEIINEAIASGRTRFAFELLPPLKGDGMGGVFAAIDRLIGFDPAYINVTFHREALKEDIRPDGSREWHIMRRRPGTVGISAAIRRKYDVEVVPHLVCGGLDRHTIENILIDLNFLDIDNVMALRGDPAPGERFFTPTRGGHAYCSDLVRQISDMNRGVYLDELQQNPIPTHFCIGVAGYPEKHYESPNLSQDIRNLKRKVDAGADYIVTQLFFDNARFFDFVERCRAEGITVPIIPGLKPVSSLKHLEMLPRTFHIDMPEALTEELSRCRTDEQAKEVGIEWSVGQAKELKAAGVPAIHFYTMSRSGNICEILKRVF